MLVGANVGQQQTGRREERVQRGADEARPDLCEARRNEAVNAWLVSVEASQQLQQLAGDG